MGTVTLRSIAGPFEFTRRTMLRHENGNKYLAPATFRFSFENNFTTAVPLDVWDDLSEQFADSKLGVRYRDILKPQ